VIRCFINMVMYDIIHQMMVSRTIIIVVVIVVVAAEPTSEGITQILDLYVS